MSVPADRMRDDRDSWRLPEVAEAIAALEQAERFVAEIERRDIHPETGEPNFNYAPAIATARSVLVEQLEQAREALRWFASEEAWAIPLAALEDDRYGFDAPGSVHSTPWGFAREALRGAGGQGGKSATDDRAWDETP